MAGPSSTILKKQDTKKFKGDKILLNCRLIYFGDLKGHSICMFNWSKKTCGGGEGREKGGSLAKSSL